MATDPVMDRIMGLFGPFGPLQGMIDPRRGYDPNMMFNPDTSVPLGMARPDSMTMLGEPSNVFDVFGPRPSAMPTTPMQGPGLIPMGSAGAPPPQAQAMPQPGAPMPLDAAAAMRMPQPKPQMPPQAMPGAGVAGGGSNPIMAGNRILPFTPEQAAQARSIGSPDLSAMMPGPGSTGGGMGGGPTGGGLGGFFGSEIGQKVRDALLGMAMGSTPQESIAGAAQMVMSGSERRALEGDVNRTRQLAVSLGIPPETAGALPAKELLPMIRQIQMDRLKPVERKTTVVDGRLVDSATGEVVYEAPNAGASKPTDDMREYDLYVQQERAAGREPKSFSGYQIMMKEAGRNQVNIETGTKLPPGYRWIEPGNPNSSVEPIPGGPATAISGEIAARVGMADSFLGQAPAIRERLAAGEATGPIDRFMGGNISSSSQAEVMRQIKSGMDALQRMLTGAGMPVAEAAEYERRYLPTYTDDAESSVQKLDQLVRELERVKTIVTRGRGEMGTPPVPDDAGGWTDLGGGIRMRQVQ